MEGFLPSEIARLVLGYLKEIECMNTYHSFLEECEYLREYVGLLRKGREYPTKIGGLSLEDILNEYALMKDLKKQKGTDVSLWSKLDSVIYQLKHHVNQSESTQTVTNQSESTQTVTNKSESTQTVSNHSESTQTVSNQSESTQTVTNQSESTQTIVHQSEQTETVFCLSEKMGIVTNQSEETQTVFHKSEQVEFINNQSESKLNVRSQSEQVETVTSPNKTITESIQHEILGQDNYDGPKIESTTCTTISPVSQSSQYNSYHSLQRMRTRQAMKNLGSDKTSNTSQGSVEGQTEDSPSLIKEVANQYSGVRTRVLYHMDTDSQDDVPVVMPSAVETPSVEDVKKKLSGGTKSPKVSKSSVSIVNTPPVCSRITLVAPTYSITGGKQQIFLPQNVRMLAPCSTVSTTNALTSITPLKMIPIPSRKAKLTRGRPRTRMTTRSTGNPPVTIAPHPTMSTYVIPSSYLKVVPVAQPIVTCTTTSSSVTKIVMSAKEFKNPPTSNSSPNQPHHNAPTSSMNIIKTSWQEAAASLVEPKANCEISTRQFGSSSTLTKEVDSMMPETEQAMQNHGPENEVEPMDELDHVISMPQFGDNTNDAFNFSNLKGGKQHAKVTFDESSICLKTPMKKTDSSLKDTSSSKSPRRKSHTPKRRDGPPSVTKRDVTPDVTVTEGSSTSCEAPPEQINIPLVLEQWIKNEALVEKMAENINRVTRGMNQSMAGGKDRSDTVSTPQENPVTEKVPEAQPAQSVADLDSFLEIHGDDMSCDAINGVIEMTRNDADFDALFKLFNVDKHKFIEKEYGVLPPASEEPLQGVILSCDEKSEKNTVASTNRVSSQPQESIPSLLPFSTQASTITTSSIPPPGVTSVATTSSIVNTIATSSSCVSSSTLIDNQPFISAPVKEIADSSRADLLPRTTTDALCAPSARPHEGVMEYGDVEDKMASFTSYVEQFNTSLSQDEPNNALMNDKQEQKDVDVSDDVNIDGVDKCKKKKKRKTPRRRRSKSKDKVNDNENVRKGNTLTAVLSEGTEIFMSNEQSSVATVNSTQESLHENKQPSVTSDIVNIPAQPYPQAESLSQQTNANDGMPQTVTISNIISPKSNDSAAEKNKVTTHDIHSAVINEEILSDVNTDLNKDPDPDQQQVLNDTHFLQPEAIDPPPLSLDTNTEATDKPTNRKRETSTSARTRKRVNGKNGGNAARTRASTKKHSVNSPSEVFVAYQKISVTSSSAIPIIVHPVCKAPAVPTPQTGSTSRTPRKSASKFTSKACSPGLAALVNIVSPNSKKDKSNMINGQLKSPRNKRHTDITATNENKASPKLNTINMAAFRALTSSDVMEDTSEDCTNKVNQKLSMKKSMKIGRRKNPPKRMNKSSIQKKSECILPPSRPLDNSKSGDSQSQTVLQNHIDSSDRTLVAENSNVSTFSIPSATKFVPNGSETGLPSAIKGTPDTIRSCPPGSVGSVNSSAGSSRSAFSDGTGYYQGVDGTPDDLDFEKHKRLSKDILSGKHIRFLKFGDTLTTSTPKPNSALSKKAKNVVKDTLKSRKLVKKRSELLLGPDEMLKKNRNNGENPQCTKAPSIVSNNELLHPNSTHVQTNATTQQTCETGAHQGITENNNCDSYKNVKNNPKVVYSGIQEADKGVPTTRASSQEEEIAETLVTMADKIMTPAKENCQPNLLIAVTPGKDVSSRKEIPPLIEDTPHKETTPRKYVAPRKKATPIKDTHLMNTINTANVETMLNVQSTVGSVKSQKRRCDENELSEKKCKKPKSSKDKTRKKSLLAMDVDKFLSTVHKA